MKLMFYPFETTLSFDSSVVNVLEIHDTNLFYNATSSLFLACEGQDGKERFLLFDSKGDEVSFSKQCLMINDIFNIEINDKKIIGKLHEKIIKDLSLDEELVYKLGVEYNRFLNNFLEVFNSYDLELIYTIDFSLKDFLKMLKVGIEEDEGDFEKNLFTFIDLVAEFNLFEILIFANIKVYFTDERLIEFYKYCNYKKVKLLLLEPKNNRKLLEYETKLVIDENYDDFLVKI